MTTEHTIRIIPVDLGAQDGAIVATINAQCPEAEAHVWGHVARGFDTVLICGPECDGTQR